VRLRDGLNVGRICTRQVATISKDRTVLEAARRMRDEHVGDLVVVDELEGGRRVPVGVLTDREARACILIADDDASTRAAGR